MGNSYWPLTSDLYVRRMRTRKPAPHTTLNRRDFARAGSGKRLKLTREWLCSGTPSADDLNYVRNVRERDLANARALYGPGIALIAIVITLFTLSMNIRSLFGVVAAGAAVLISLFGVYLELRRVMKISDQLAELDACVV
ncbi:hypothetical protein [Microbacterium aurum]|nr:hypothetical protein [Microbacterium aurum]